MRRIALALLLTGCWNFDELGTGFCARSDAGWCRDGGTGGGNTGGGNTGGGNTGGGSTGGGNTGGGNTGGGSAGGGSAGGGSTGGGSEAHDGGRAPADGGAFLISGTATPSSQPVVAYGGDQFLVAWRCGSTICLQRLAADGSLLGAHVSLAGNGLSQPAVTFAGDRFFVVWTDPTAVGPRSFIQGCGVHLDGGILVGPPILQNAAYDYSAPAVAASGATALVVATEDHAGDRAIVGVLLTGGAPSPFTIADPSVDRTAPSVAARTMDFVVAWQQNTSPLHVAAARVPFDGGTTNPNGLEPCGGSATNLSPKIAARGDALVYTWLDGQSMPVVAAQNGPMLQPTCGMSAGQVGAANPMVAAGDRAYLTAWDIDVSGTRQVWGQHLDAAGGLAGSAVRLSPLGEPAVGAAGAGNATHFLVVWTSGTAIKGALINAP